MWGGEHLIRSWRSKGGSDQHAVCTASQRAMLESPMDETAVRVPSPGRMIVVFVVT